MVADLTPGAALRRWGHHDSDCADGLIHAGLRRLPRECTCGLDATLARFDRAVEVGGVAFDQRLGGCFVSLDDGSTGRIWVDGFQVPLGDRVTVLVLPAGPGEGEGRG